MQQQAQTRGLFRRECVEKALTYPPLLRPFREVLWHVRTDNSEFWSLIDEDLSRLSLTPDQQLLLWRPLYAKCAWEEGKGHNVSSVNSNPNDSLLQATVDDLIARRLAAQHELDKSEDEIRKVQADRRAAVALIIPRLPSSVRKQQELEQERRPSQGVQVATSLVMNCPQDAIVTMGTLGQRVWVTTMMIEYQNLETKSSRLVFLESPTAGSLEDAVSSGRALTRLCHLNESVSDYVHRQFSTANSTYSPL
jgi:hypothetical protein